MNNKQSSKEYFKEYYQANKAFLIDKTKKYYNENRDKKLLYAKKYREKNSDKISKIKSKWFQDNKKSVYLKRKTEDHKQYCRKYTKIRKANERASEGSFSREEWDGLLEYFEYKCAYCKKETPLEPDHVIPISRNGSSFIDNILPACRSCNAKKGAKSLEIFRPDYAEHMKEFEKK